MLSYEPLPLLNLLRCYTLVPFITFIFQRGIFNVMSERRSMYIKEYNSGSELLVAVCDQELVGRSFKDGELHLTVSERFYKGEEATEEDVIGSLRHATIANLVGRRAIQCALDHKFIDETSIIVVDGVPHAQMLKL